MVDTRHLVQHRDAKGFFRESMTSALRERQLQAADDTIAYVVNLLATFIRSDELFEVTPDGLRLKPLALFYTEALEAPSARLRQQILQRLGDVALFVSGMFAESFHRKAIDVDYYIDMGANAYGYLSGTVPASAATPHAAVFSELSEKFAAFVDVLNQIGGRNVSAKDHADVLRLYERWLKSGSETTARRLRSLGVLVPQGVHRVRH